MRAVCPHLERWAGCRFKPRPTIVEPLDGWDVKGDLACASTANFPFSVECKKVEGWELTGLFESQKWPVWAWWEQCTAQARASKSRHPLLIFSANGRKNYVLVRRATFAWLKPQPAYGPIAHVQHPRREALVLLLLDDLVRTTIPRG